MHVCSQAKPSAAQAAQEHGGTDPAYGAEVEGAIQAAFLSGTDDDFSELLEVGVCLSWCTLRLSCTQA